MLIMYNSICIRVTIMLNPSIKSEGLQIKYDSLLLERPHIIQTFQTPQQNECNQTMETHWKIKVSLTYATQDGFGCFFVLWFSFEPMFKLLPYQLLWDITFFDKFHIRLRTMIVHHLCSL